MMTSTLKACALLALASAGAAMAEPVTPSQTAAASRQTAAHQVETRAQPVQTAGIPASLPMPGPGMMATLLAGIGLLGIAARRRPV